MKKLLLLFLFFPALVSFGQAGNSTDKYAAGRSIIRDLDSIVAPKGIQENFETTIGGLRQWVFVRGQNSNNPVLLFVHGGPASPMSPVMWMFQRPFEEYFTIVQYDQRASGKTFLANDTTGLAGSLHISRYVDDAIELTRLIEKKYAKKKVILVGHSWGTIVAMKAALQEPGLYYAYIGIGQVINTRENERVSYAFALREAQRFKNDSALGELKSIAPYPGNTPITRDRIGIARKWAQYYGGLTAYRHDSRYFFYAPFLSPDYTMKEVEAIDNGNLFTLGRILPEFLNVDFNQVTRFPIPVFMFMGRHDYTTPSEPTANWLKKVQAPFKKATWFEHSAHLVPLEEPGKMLMTLINDVLPLTAGNKHIRANMAK